MSDEQVPHPLAQAGAERVELDVALQVFGDAPHAGAHVRLERPTCWAIWKRASPWRTTE